MIACGINESTRCSLPLKSQNKFILFTQNRGEEEEVEKSELKSGSDIHKRTST